MPNKYKIVLDALKSEQYVPSTETNIPPLTELELVEMEKRLGSSFPVDYRDFLCYLPTHGYFNFADVGVPNNDENGIVHDTICTFSDNPVRDYYLFTENLKDDPYQANDLQELRLIRDMEGIDEIGWPQELLPIACDWGLGAICIAISGFRSGAVFWMKANPSTGRNDNFYLIANSFDEFMSMLKPQDN